ncbi:hypothetical protein IRP63_14095 (plasmid) [Clostridium botulinum]|uniref:Uncharacterized protein n=1 Tax=Clostridium botulinum C/D str. DC5 TaxID=1443128 RepID=A0A0A0I1I1_CLOBO|nr:hypothetical protein [Clostridium botulinum]KGM93525.1 hypothetical protein Z955_14790 [Clostridium botulinum C/D str. DC5]KOC56875.1 hypothetical protein ADU89_01375 [Clostridium botulinum]KOC57350.1 hypothetical protein ADU90_05915 [Clostridium botulinum]MCD3232583.1 hypothetical protein [Clostridium botulinum D/C]MCD3238488.1 hypothetical protein [Clostridium botulinum D/C]
MGLDATLFKIKFKVNNDLEYEKIKDKKWKELNKDCNQFEKWRCDIWTQVLYTSSWDIAHLIDQRNIGNKQVDFEDARDLVLDKEDIQIILQSMKLARQNVEYENVYEELDEHIEELTKCLETTDFKKETLLYGEWF